VIIRVRAAAINPVDYKAPKAVLGPVAGLDLAGVVESVPEGFKGSLKLGDEVYGTAKGSLADLVLANASSLALKPKSVSFTEAAAMPTTYLTSLQGLRDHGGLPSGGRVLIIGASGGCGTAGTQLAKTLGASHIVGVCSGKNADYVRSHGADRVVDYACERIEESFGAADKADNALRFDVVYDCATNSGGGEDYKAASLKCLKSPSGEKGSGGAGQYVAINGAAGMWVRHFTGVGQKKHQHLFLTDANTKDLSYLAGLADADGTAVRPVVSCTLPFSHEGVSEGFRLLQSRRVVGKVVFDIAGAGAGAAAVVASSGAAAQAEESERSA
jgi:NADPH:quinone reductase-like Zn-dependent oxidoreductase